MPRVSDEHLAARRQQILDAARRCFLRDGFHNTSMQDVIAEAGLSVGAVYRYFRSKNDLVMSIAETAIGTTASVFTEILAHDPPLPLISAMERALRYVDAEVGEDGVLRIAMQVWAESLRDPALAEFVAEKYRGFQQQFTLVAAHAVKAGELPADIDVAAVGSALFGIVPGYVVQRILTGAPDPAMYLAGLCGLISRSGQVTDG